MNVEELKQRFPNASPAFIRANAVYSGQTAVLDDGSRQVAELERDFGDGAVGAISVQGKIGCRFFVRVTSYRKRLLDEDNLCEKYVVDLLRYAGVLPSDAPGAAKIEVCQEKVGPKEPERTEIEVYELR